MLCFAGSYAIRKNLSDVVVMLIFGLPGYLMRKFDLHTTAVVPALILGPISEKGLPFLRADRRAKAALRGKTSAAAGNMKIV